MKIFMMGDSTMKQNNITTYPQTGWGQVLHLFAQKNVSIEVHAENGRSTKSFRDEGRFQAILDKLNQGDYVICQFGHNDEKKEDPMRFTEPYGTYQENLAYYAEEVEKKGAHIVFATSITRHHFVDGKCIDSHLDYAQTVLDFANKTHHTCIDMNRLTGKLYTQMGVEATKKFHMVFDAGVYRAHPEGKDDHTHLRHAGALMVAEIFVRSLAKTQDPMNECFLDLSKIETIYDISFID